VTIRNPDAAIPDGVAIGVTLAAFKDGFRMCSRSGPSWVTSYWEVAPEDVQRVDVALLAYLRNAPGKVKTPDEVGVAARSPLSEQQAAAPVRQK